MKQPRTPRDLIALLGRKRVCELVGVTTQSITNALTAGLLPGSWYATLQQEAAQRGIECDPALFRVRRGETA